MKLSDAERWEYSSRKWCSADQEYLNPARSAISMYSSSLRSVSCSLRTFPSRQCFGWYMFVKMPNSIESPSCDGWSDVVAAAGHRTPTGQRRLNPPRQPAAVDEQLSARHVRG